MVKLKMNEQLQMALRTGVQIYRNLIYQESCDSRFNSMRDVTESDWRIMSFT